MPKYGKIRGAIRWYSRLPNLRKPIFAPIYSRLLTWVNTVYRGSGGRYSRYFAGGFALRRCQVSGGTRQHQNASSEASSHYSHSTENSSVVVVRCVSICTLMFCRLRDIQSVCTHSVLASKITPDVPKRKLCQRLGLGS